MKHKLMKIMLTKVYEYTEIDDIGNETQIDEDCNDESYEDTSSSFDNTIKLEIDSIHLIIQNLVFLEKEEYNLTIFKNMKFFLKNKPYIGKLKLINFSTSVYIYINQLNDNSAWKLFLKNIKNEKIKMFTNSLKFTSKTKISSNYENIGFLFLNEVKDFFKNFTIGLIKVGSKEVCITNVDNGKKFINFLKKGFIKSNKCINPSIASSNFRLDFSFNLSSPNDTI